MAIILSLRAFLSSDHMRVSITKGSGVSLEILEVFFGPFDFYLISTSRS